MIACLIFSLFLSLTLVLGKSLYASSSIFPLFSSASGAALTVGKIVLLSVLFLAALTAFFSLTPKIRIGGNSEKSRLHAFFRGTDERHLLFPLFWFALSLCDIPALLAYYPGVFSYDLTTQTQMLKGLRPLTSGNPPLHTWLWGFFLKLEAVTGVYAVTLYALVQILFLSFCLAAVLTGMHRRGVPASVVLLSFLFFALNPVIHIFSIIPVKDVLFGCFFILSFSYLTDLASDPDAFFASAGRMVRLSLSVLGACLFRHNAFYAFLVFLPVALIAMRRFWRQVLLCLMPAFVLYYAMTSLLFPALGVQAGKTREMYSVPIQQISLCAVRHADELTEEDLAMLNDYFPDADLEKLYNPRFADPVKLHTDLYTPDRSAGFIRLWLTFLKRYPADYIDAFLDLNLPYWYLPASSVDPYSRREYIETSLPGKKIYPVKRASLIPGLLWRYQKVAGYTDLQKNPFFVCLLSISLPLWVLLFTGLALIVRKKSIFLLVLTPAVLYYLTFLLGPVSNCRYIFPLMLLYPGCVSLLTGVRQSS